MPTRLKTGQLRRGSTSISPNPYDLYSSKEIVDIGQAVKVHASKDLVLLRRQLRDFASQCLRTRAERARMEPPSVRSEWLKTHIIAPANKLQRNLRHLKGRRDGYVQDLEAVLLRPESTGTINRFLKQLEDDLFTLEQWSEEARYQLDEKEQPRGETWFVQTVVDGLSHLYLLYQSVETLGLNRRYPESSPYMSFVQKAAAPILGRKHACMDQMANFSRTYNSRAVKNTSEK